MPDGGEPSDILPADATYAQVRDWLRARHPDLDAAVDDVDRSLLLDTLRLTPRERVDRASATARWIGRFKAVARPVGQ